MRFRTTAATMVVGLAALGTIGLAPAAGATGSASMRNAPFQSLLATLKDPVGAAGDQFGRSVAVSGKTAVVGANYTSGYAGAAYIYVTKTSGWRTTPKVTLSDPAATPYALFGTSVAMSGNTIVVGADGSAQHGISGWVYVYVKGASGWPTTPTASIPDPLANKDDYFGSSLGLSGNTIIVGAPSTDSGLEYSGAAYLYVEGTSGWPTTPTVSLPDPTVHRGDYFGLSVAVSGKTAFVGSPGTDSDCVYVYVEGTSGWPTTATLTLRDPAGGASDYFGSSVAVSGKTAVVGADAAGLSPDETAYIYVKAFTSGWPTTPGFTLPAPAGAADFGSTVALSGTTVAVGADATNGSSGAAYLYLKGTSGWPTTPTISLSDPGAAEYDYFGSSIAVSGTTALIGARNGPDFGNGGLAYIYQT